MDDLTGRSQFTRNMAVYWISEILVILVGFVIPRQISDHLGTAALGAWDMGWATYKYLTMTGIGAMGVTRYIALNRARQDNEAIARIYSISTILQGFVSVIILFAAILLTGFAARLDLGSVEASEVQALIMFFCLAICIRLLGDPSRGVITGVHRWDLHHLINASQDILLAAALVVPLKLGGGLVLLGLVVLGSSVFTSLSRLVIMRRI